MHVSRIMLSMALLATALGIGCARIPVLPGLPDTLAERVDRSVSFRELKSSPTTYTDHLMTLGGEVLSVRPEGNGTLIEILQLPLDEWEVPKAKKTTSQGRFLAYHQNGEFDPAVLEGHTPVTIVGEVTGMKTKTIGRKEHILPVLDVQYLKVWSERPTATSRWDSPPYAPYRFFLLP